MANTLTDYCTVPILSISTLRTIIRSIVNFIRIEVAPISRTFVQRKFVASDINQLWVADMTYVPT